MSIAAVIGAVRGMACGPLPLNGPSSQVSIGRSKSNSIRAHSGALIASTAAWAASSKRWAAPACGQSTLAQAVLAIASISRAVLGAIDRLAELRASSGGGSSRHSSNTRAAMLAVSAKLAAA